MRAFRNPFTKLGTYGETICLMDITRFLQKPSTPVPIPTNASTLQEQYIIAGNFAMKELSGKKKERQRITFQPRIK